MAVDAKSVKELREKTGAGMLDCKKALEEANGDLTKAVEILREKGLSAAANKAALAVGVLAYAKPACRLYIIST